METEKASAPYADPRLTIVVGVVLLTLGFVAPGVGIGIAFLVGMAVFAVNASKREKA